jgi:hypothetical protein
LRSDCFVTVVVSAVVSAMTGMLPSGRSSDDGRATWDSPHGPAVAGVLGAYRRKGSTATATNSSET